MRFRCERDEFARVVASVAPGLPARPSNPSHMGMLVQADKEMIMVTASDGDTTFNNTVTPEEIEPGGFVFPRIFPEIVKSLTGKEVEVEVAGTSGAIHSGRSSFTFSVEDGEKYPFPLLDVNVPLIVTGFQDALKKVLPAVDGDNPVPALTTVMIDMHGLDGLSLVTTDKYVLAWATCPSTLISVTHFPDNPALLPGRLAQRIARMDGETVKVGWDDNRFQVRSGGFTITCRLMDGQFPLQWTKILTMGETWTRLPDDLAATIKRAALVLDDHGAVELEFGPELVVRSDGKANFIEYLPLEFEGLVNVKVGYKMLLDALAWCNEVSVGRPLVFRGEGVKYMVQTRRET